MADGTGIVDAHTHLGECRIFDETVSEEDLLKGMTRNGISVSIVQPFPGAPDPFATHDRIAELASRYPYHFYGMVSLRPYLDAGEYEREVERCVQSLGFVGVKMHPLGHPVHPLASAAQRIAEACIDQGVPLMIHTGPGLPWTAPSLFIPMARDYPDLKIVLAHAGWGLFTLEALVVAETCDNVFLETSWITSTQLQLLVRRLGAERLMLGSDVPLNLPTELTKHRTIGLSEDELTQCLWGTARHVFSLDDPAIQPPELDL